LNQEDINQLSKSRTCNEIAWRILPDY
jgi:hypothetical protein